MSTPPTVIPATVGRVVWVRMRAESRDRLQPEVAFIVYVHNDRLVNVAGFNSVGHHFAMEGLQLVQDGDVAADAAPLAHPHAVWMPYQKGQAAKVEALEAALKDGYTKL